MGIEFDEIRKGRRRDWDKLRDPEDVRREKREKREADPEYQKRKTALRKRDEYRADERDREMEEWRVLKRKLAIGGAIALAVMLLWTGTRMAIGWGIRQSRAKSMTELMAKVDAGQPFEGYATPLEAMASWRSAWMRKDAEGLLRTYSLRQRGQALSRGSEARFVRNMQQRMDAGGMDRYVEIARQFDPAIVHYPMSPRDGELAVFKSDFVDPRLPEGRNAQVWYLAVSWDDRIDKWFFEDLRVSSTWRERWTKASQIPVRRDVVED